MYNSYNVEDDTKGSYVYRFLVSSFRERKESTQSLFLISISVVFYLYISCSLLLESIGHPHSEAVL